MSLGHTCIAETAVSSQDTLVSTLKVLSADVATFVLQGASLHTGRSEAYAFTVTGFETFSGRSLVVDTATYSFTGYHTITNYNLVALTAQFSLEGHLVDLLWNAATWVWQGEPSSSASAFWNSDVEVEVI